ncbi:AAA family ATPase [Adlercreutzia sp. R7]|uniref:AAA family ATPase n=1 Tax=Adlercreutzia wanghongyangiae TaxID=3111451 RepID=A0ABU6IFI2_9ACTN|nr:AAA family ATPase [Adlercreutzia sp. R7]
MTSAPRSPFLQYLRIDRFGRFTDYTVGPFGPHLNIVFGANEAGKTTLASFVGGVLFGWEEARGNRNTYKPVGAERAGSLFFAPFGDGEAAEPASATERLSTGSSETLMLFRGRNADGLQGDVDLAADIDKDTFRTMFSLNSDELRSLRNTTDTTAKLLTAGSGAGSSPAHALAHVNERLAAFTSRAAAVEQSIPQLAAQRNEARAAERAAAEQADQWRAQDRELHELEPERAAMADRVDESNRLIEDLTAAKSSLAALADEQASLQAEYDRARAAEEEARQDARVGEAAIEPALTALTASEDRSLRDRLDSLAAREARQAHSVEVAQANYNSSRAVYEALLETEDDEADRRHARWKRSMQMAFLVVVPAVLLLLGVPLFIMGRDRASLTYMALGAALSAFAALMVVGGFLMLFRPDKEGNVRKERFNDAHWVMVQDEKKLEACRAAEAAAARQTSEELAGYGLASAHGSLRQARVLLDEAREGRAAVALCRQRQQASAARAAAAGRRLQEIAAERAALLGRVGLDADATADEVEGELEHRIRQRAGLLDAFESMNRRSGELASILGQARHELTFDQCKLETEQISTRLEEAKTDFVRLLLAKHMLEAAIATWESKRQPEVYAKASRLLSMMTEGRWVEVVLTGEGTLEVVDAVKTRRAPVHLSLGTCQQLYLALRIALLTTAENVGRAIPILADDILVNFDERRRAGAARALVELAEARQVILFTCHEDAVRALKKAAKQAGRPATVVNL